jgi:hypothetical protein
MKASLIVNADGRANLCVFFLILQLDSFFNFVTGSFKDAMLCFLTGFLGGYVTLVFFFSIIH